jgi:CRP-like cAMP-binding protein
MIPADWELLLLGAQDVQYSKGEVIVQEGQKHQRIYQLSTGSVDIMKSTPEGPKRIVTLYPKRAPEVEVFGELTFLDPDNQLVCIFSSFIFSTR